MRQKKLSQRNFEIPQSSLRFQSHPGVGWERSGNRCILVHLHQGATYQLEESGADIWVWLMQGNSLTQIRRRLEKAYRISGTRTEQELRSFIKLLEKHDLVMIKSVGEC
jgi:hypothetical protein